MRNQSPAIVLRRWPYSEHSLILRVLTPDCGTLSLLAKGVQQLKSGSLGLYDTWAFVQIEYGGKEGAEMWNLYSGSLLDRMSGLSKDSRRLVAAGILAELAEVGAPPGQAAHALFLWLQRWLQHLDQGAKVDSLLCAALLEVLSELGLEPHFPTELPPADQELWFAPATGGLVTGNHGQRPSAHARRIQHHELAYLQALRQQPEICLQQEGAPAAACLTILGEFLHYHLERPPKAWQFLHSSDVPKTQGS